MRAGISCFVKKNVKFVFASFQRLALEILNLLQKQTALAFPGILLFNLASFWQTSSNPKSEPLR